MDDANEQARQDPAVRQSLEVISRRWGIGQEDLLRWSFIPREVLGLLEIKRQASLERKLAGRDIRRLRQLQTRRPEVHGEVPILRGQELRAHKARLVGLKLRTRQGVRAHLASGDLGTGRDRLVRASSASPSRLTFSQHLSSRLPFSMSGMFTWVMRNVLDLDLLETSDVARLLHLTPAAIRAMVRRGRLPVAVRTPRGARLFRRADVLAVAAGRRQAGSARA